MQSKSNLFRWLCNKSWFREEIKQVYIEHYDYISGISADGGLLDTLRARYAAVFAHNFEKWSVRRHWLNYQKAPLATYGENFAFLKDWCAARNAWLTEYYELFPQDEKLLGDADGDGKVTILDATAIQRVLAKLGTKSYQERAADADGDGEVTILDATAIQRYLAKLKTNEGIAKKLI